MQMPFAGLMTRMAATAFGLVAIGFLFAVVSEAINQGIGTTTAAGYAVDVAGLLAGAALLVLRLWRVVRAPRSWLWTIWIWLPVWGLLLASVVAAELDLYGRDGSVQPAAGIFAVLGALFLYWRTGRLINFAHLDGTSHVERGAVLVDGDALQRAMYGKKFEIEPVHIQLGGVVVPVLLEAQHLLFAGTTGSGKTQSFYRVLDAVRARNNGRAIVADPAGGFYARYGEPGDVLLNPFDARTAHWSPFAEIRDPYDCQRIAHAAIPARAGDGGEWNHYAQTLLGETLAALHSAGTPSVKRLLHYVSTADRDELGELLAGTPAAILAGRGNDRMLASTRSIIATYLAAWRYLDDAGTFSVRDWVRDEGGDGWLFITYRDDQMGLLRTLVAALLELALVEGLTLDENPSRNLWFVLDELDSLGKVASLDAGLAKLRKYGGSCVLGLQTISQLRETYGRETAQTLLANCSTKLILRAGDNETAEYFSRELGEQDIARLAVSQSEGASSGGTSVSTNVNVHHVRQSAVLASEVLNLPDLHGFLKLPGQPIGRVALEYRTILPREAAYQPRTAPAPASDGS